MIEFLGPLLIGLITLIEGMLLVAVAVVPTILLGPRLEDHDGYVEVRTDPRVERDPGIESRRS